MKDCQSITFSDMSVSVLAWYGAGLFADVSIWINSYKSIVLTQEPSALWVHCDWELIQTESELSTYSFSYLFSCCAGLLSPCVPMVDRITQESSEKGPAISESIAKPPRLLTCLFPLFKVDNQFVSVEGGVLHYSFNLCCRKQANNRTCVIMFVLSAPLTLPTMDYVYGSQC